MRVIVTGSRDWIDRVTVNQQLSMLNWHAEGSLVVVHGCADGADRIAEQWVHATRSRGFLGVTEEAHPARWNEFKLSAGPMRNAEMVNAGADLVLAFLNRCKKPTCTRTGIHGSHGAMNCVQLARAAGIKVQVYQGDM